MPPIRVLHVVTIMDRGGLENMLMSQYRTIDREKVQYDFLTHRPKRGVYDDEIESLGGRIFRANPLTVFGLPSYLRWLLTFFREHLEYSIIHSSLNELSSFVLWASKRAGVKTRIAHSHVASGTKDWKYPFRVISKLFIPPVATHLFACSIEAGVWGFGKANIKRVRVIPNAIDTERFRFNKDIREHKRRELGLDGRFVIGHVARFTPEKNHCFLIGAFSLIHASNPDARLLLLGDGPLMNDIKKKAEPLGSAVIFMGARDDISDLYQAMDAFVLPSLYEGLGIVAVEAQATGLPCFLSDQVPNATFITPLAEKIALSDGPDYWAEQILSYKAGERDSRTDDVIKANFDVTAVAKEMEEFYLGEV